MTGAQVGSESSRNILANQQSIANILATKADTKHKKASTEDLMAKLQDFKSDAMRRSAQRRAETMKAEEYVSGDSQSFRKLQTQAGDRKSTRLNSSHRCISYAVFCLKKKKVK